MATTKRASPSKRSRTQMRSYAGTERGLRTQPRVIAFAVALLPWSFISPAYADVAPSTLPTGGTVTAGSANISTSGSNMQITQGSSSAILNWQSFSIGSGAWVNFSQPSSSAIALNRVLGNNPSEIFGRLTANGQIFLSNPNGVLFAPGAAVDVGALFATTLSIADKDFLAGRYNFYNAGRAGSVINQGHIVAANGYAALAGPQVRNDGIIVANAGTVALAAGDRVQRQCAARHGRQQQRHHPRAFAHRAQWRNHPRWRLGRRREPQRHPHCVRHRSRHDGWHSQSARPIRRAFQRLEDRCIGRRRRR
ncbi:MAG: filamentous hemagglutinin N-terminal domain-containing protein [Betaproteobacteria bacterium]|nr:MAG: filamentous hemagglutinin N-terminal domain-containing protein [Betaproteobacteria bacterium]